MHESRDREVKLRLGGGGAQRRNRTVRHQRTAAPGCGLDRNARPADVYTMERPINRVQTAQLVWGRQPARCGKLRHVVARGHGHGVVVTIRAVQFQLESNVSGARSSQTRTISCIIERRKRII